MSATKFLPIGAIRIDGGTQMRLTLDQDWIAELAELVTNDVPLPPIGVVYDGESYWLWDGFHRRAAHAQADADSIECEIRPGVKQDAVMLAIGANKAPTSLRRDRATKEAAVKAYLELKPNDSTSLIAEYIGVRRDFIEAIRKAQVDPGSSQKPPAVAPERILDTKRDQSPPPTERTGRDGKSYPVTPPKDTPISQKPEPPKDETGTPIEQDSVAKAFAVLPDIKLLVRELMAWYKRANAIRAALNNDWLREDDLHAKYRELLRELEGAAPHSVCRQCGGPGCRVCKQTGYVSQFHYRSFLEKQEAMP